MFVLLVLFVLSFVAWECIIFYRRRASLPPGPFPVPLLGNFIHEITPPYFHIGLKRLTARFGKIYTVYMPYPVVNIVDYETIKETFRGNDVTGRLRSAINDVVGMVPNGGIVNSEGPEWQEQRRFAIATLRDFGMGKNLMEEQVRVSAQRMVDYLNTQDHSNADLRWPIQVFVANIINEFLFGFQYPFDDCGKLTEFVEQLDHIMKGMAKSFVVPIVFMAPWSRHLPGISYFWGKVERRMRTLVEYIKETAAAVEYDPAEEPKCYVQAFRKNNNDQRVEQLVTCCMDLTIAGQETTTTTMRWAMLLLAAHSDVQEKLRAEIHEHIGRERVACMADKSKMPYTNAVIHEIQRRANIIPANIILYHKTTVDTEIAGHKVPANTLVNGDIHQMMTSDPLFEQPHRFWPERYIAEDGVTLKKELVDRTLPFGVGKRQCAGEGLARVELFIGLCALIQNFRILPIPGCAIDLEPIYANVLFPKPQNFRLEKV